MKQVGIALAKRNAFPFLLLFNFWDGADSLNHRQHKIVGWSVYEIVRRDFIYTIHNII